MMPRMTLSPALQPALDLRLLAADHADCDRARLDFVVFGQDAHRVAARPAFFHGIAGDDQDAAHVAQDELAGRVHARLDPRDRGS